MAQVSFTEFRADPARFFDEAGSSRAPLLVTRTGRSGVALLAEGIKGPDTGLGEEWALIRPETGGAAG